VLSTGRQMSPTLQLIDLILLLFLAVVVLVLKVHPYLMSQTLLGRWRRGADDPTLYGGVTSCATPWIVLDIFRIKPINS
jgi:hypothetical protein